MKKKITLSLLILSLFIGGGYFIYEGLKIEIKGKVAQLLLHHTWNNILETGKLNKPWSSFDGNPIMLMNIPKYNINQVILEGTSGQSLAFGPSFHQESFLPFESGITVISAHRDTHGKYIKKLKTKDIIKLQDQFSNWHQYRVENSTIINVEEGNIYTNNVDRLFIITCYPFDTVVTGTPYRYIVSAKKI